MRLIISIFILFIIFCQRSYAYDQVQLDECITSAMSNPSVTGVSEEKINNYCSCALDLIVDKNLDVRQSGYKCAIDNFG